MAESETQRKHSSQPPQLIRKDGTYYIDYEGRLTGIEDWEAEEVRQHPELVYDIIVSHWRKYYFNVAEDSITSIRQHGY